jgi:cell division protein FtsZ
MGSASASGTNRSSLAIEKALDSPLLNDNKITGAQNVLLLIVSGKDEITIDEIGEINDHIQNQAGNSANIIMGVGEDESLDDAISVTVIATGFNSEQQDEIVNTETKKIIHTLEDEQKAEIDLTENTKKTTPLDLKESTTNSEKKIVHKLDIDELEAVTEENNQAEDENPILSTTDDIRNIDVDAEFIEIEEEFEITDKTEIETKENKTEKRLTFDLFHQEFESKSTETKSANDYESSSQQIKSKKVVFDLNEDLKAIEVNEPEIVQPDYSESKKVHQLEEEETPKETEDDSYHFETKVKAESETARPENPKEEQGEIDPLNASISELKARAAERRAKMKQFNYRFSNGQNIDEIEKQPAYKRAGVELEDNRDKNQKLSRTSLYDEGDDISFRKNNSFLHDNVD